MNRHQDNFTARREARLRYLGGDYEILTPGDFVRCAVTGEPVPLDRLCYWNVELQEAYSSAEVACKRYLELRGAK